MPPFTAKRHKRTIAEPMENQFNRLRRFTCIFDQSDAIRRRFISCGTSTSSDGSSQNLLSNGTGGEPYQKCWQMLPCRPPERRVSAPTAKPELANESGSIGLAPPASGARWRTSRASLPAPNRFSFFRLRLFAENSPNANKLRSGATDRNFKPARNLPIDSKAA